MKFFTIWHRVAVSPLRRNQCRKFGTIPVRISGWIRGERDDEEEAILRPARDSCRDGCTRPRVESGPGHWLWWLWHHGGIQLRAVPGRFPQSASLLNAGCAGTPVSNNVYANNPNAFIHRIRDNGFVPHAGIVDRRSPGYQASRWRPQQSLAQTSNNQPQPAASTATATATARRPVVPIGSFFDASRILVWPSDAPVEGDLITRAILRSGVPGRLGPGRQAQVGPNHDRDLCT